MSLGLIGRKVGMMRIFTDSGESLPVTVIDVSNNKVVQIKNTKTDGYSAIQLVYGHKKASRLNKSLSGHFAKAGVEAGSVLKEFRISEESQDEELKVGTAISASIFFIGLKVDVSGTTIGKGYAGTIKRHNFSSNRASHGNSKAHNKPGSIGMAQDPGRIFPGKKMSGQLGNVKKTIQNLEIIRVDAERSLLLLKGAVTGFSGGNVIVRPSIKIRKKIDK